MQILDNRTLLVVTALISIGSAVALISLWRAQHQRNGSGFWASGMSCIALGSVLLFGRGTLPDFLSLVIANTLYVIGFFAYLSWCAYFYRSCTHRVIRF